MVLHLLGFIVHSGGYYEDKYTVLETGGIYD